MHSLKAKGILSSYYYSKELSYFAGHKGCKEIGLETMHQDTIAAIATPLGVGAIGIVRLSGSDAIAITQRIWRGKDLQLQESHTIHYGYIVDVDTVLDEVMVSLFRAPRSFTTEDMVEISCHGSPYILEHILKLLLATGARMATAGEFTMRAFLHGRIDLAQAEAVADLIAVQSAASHDIAIKQMRGGFSHQITALRTELVNFASLLELELDFSEEDVEFVKRTELVDIIERIQLVLLPLLESFRYGNVIKNGVPVAIIGKPNAGKSTLLNALLNEERAIVSATAGTTRDTIEEVLTIEGIAFRFIDTAGIRHTADEIEGIGVEKAYDKIKDATIVLHIIDLTDTDANSSNLTAQIRALNPQAYIIGVLNKIDIAPHATLPAVGDTAIAIAARSGKNIDRLKASLSTYIKSNIHSDQTIVANLRHYEALRNAALSLEAVLKGIDQQITTDLIAAELKRTLAALGEISGEVTNDEILGTIFSKFCIGK